MAFPPLRRGFFYLPKACKAGSVSCSSLCTTSMTLAQAPRHRWQRLRE